MAHLFLLPLFFQCNYGVRFDGPYGVDYMIDGLAKEVQKRMEGVGVRGTQVTLKLKQRKKDAGPAHKFLGHGSCHNLSKSFVTKCGPTRDWNVISKIGKTLFAEMNVDKDDVRGMGIMMTKLDGTSAESGNGGRANSKNITTFFGAAKSRASDVAKAPNTAVVPAVAQQEEATPAFGGQTPSYSQIDDSVLDELPSDIRAELKGVTEEKNADGGRNANVRASNDENSIEAPPPAKDGTVGSTHEESLTRGLDLANDEHCEVVDNEALDLANYEHCEGVEDAAVDLANNEHGRGVEDEAVNLATDGYCEGVEDETANSASNKHNEGVEDEAVMDFSDVALPPLSQIHLSQVAALPSPLRKQITSKITARKSSGGVAQQPKQVRRSLKLGEGNRKRPRQVTVKQMFRLAEMKAGGPHGQGDSAISLAELKRLPFELQLEIANTDNYRPGVISPSGMKERASASPTGASPVLHPAGDGHRSNASTRSASALQDEPQEVAEDSGKGGVDTPQAVEEQQTSDFFQDDVFPLSLFMDENHDSSAEAMDQVASFLSLCVEENRMRDAVLLLRSIKSRNDSWGRVAFGRLFEQVDDICMVKHGYRLDRKGLRLS